MFCLAPCCRGASTSCWGFGIGERGFSRLRGGVPAHFSMARAINSFITSLLPP